MSVDTLTTRTTTRPAAALRSGAVIDHTKVRKHRDWRQVASEIVGLAAAFFAAAGAGGLATDTLVGVSKAFAVVAGALVGLLVWLLTEVHREGRKWVYAETDEPYDYNPSKNP